MHILPTATSVAYEDVTKADEIPDIYSLLLNDFARSKKRIRQDHKMNVSERYISRGIKLNCQINKYSATNITQRHHYETISLNMK